MIGTTELGLLSGLALLLFGGKKLPEMMRGLGQGVKEFKKGMKDISEPEKKENDIHSHPIFFLYQSQKSLVTHPSTCVRSVNSAMKIVSPG